MYSEINQPNSEATSSEAETLGEKLTEVITDRLAGEVLDTDYVGGIDSLIAQLKHPENTLEDIVLILEPVFDETYTQGIHDHEFMRRGNPENDFQLAELSGLDPTRLLDERELAAARADSEAGYGQGQIPVAVGEDESPDKSSDARAARWQIILEQEDVNGIAGLFKTVSGDTASDAPLKNVFCRIYALGYFDQTLISQGNSPSTVIQKNETNSSAKGSAES
jgi:hypothetical protein